MAYRKKKRATLSRKRKGGAVTRKNVKKTILQLQEMKWSTQYNLLNNASAITWTIVPFPFYSIQQGTANNQRIGTKIYCEAIEFAVRITPANAAVLTNGSTCRFIMWHQQRSNGAAPIATDIFDAGQAGAVVVPKFNSTKTLDYFPKRCTVIYDKMHSMVATSTNAGAVASVGPVWDAIVKVKIGKVITFGGVTLTPADVLNHNYGFGFCADDAGCCTCVVDARMRYRDA